MPLYKYRETGEREGASDTRFPVEYRRAAHGGVAEEPRLAGYIQSYKEKYKGSYLIYAKEFSGTVKERISKQVECCRNEKSFGQTF